MGDHDDQFAHGGDLPEDFQDLGACFRVQGACGLVGQDDVGVVDQGPGDGDPLFLSPGELAGLLADLVSQAHFFQDLPGSLLPLFLAGAAEGHGDGDVIQNAEVGDEVEALEDEADAVPAVVVQFLFAVLVDVLSVEADLSQIVSVQASQEVHEGGFPAAAFSQDGDELSSLEVEVYLPEGGEAPVPADAVVFAYVSDLEFHRGTCLSFVSVFLLYHRGVGVGENPVKTPGGKRKAPGFPGAWVFLTTCLCSYGRPVRLCFSVS